MVDPGFLLIAHRAGNEITALRRAEEVGADLVEADLWRYRGALEVRHTKTMGPVPLLWDRWKLEPAWRPRLGIQDLLAAAARETRFMFDLKGADPLLPAALAHAMEELAPGRAYWVCSQSWELLEAFRRQPDVRVAHSVGNRSQLQRVWDRLNWGTDHAISIHMRLLTPAVVRSLHEKASTIFTWPVNTRAAYEAVRELGVDGITSDNIELLAELAAERHRAATT